MLKFLNQGCQLNVLQQLLKVLVFHHSLNNQYLCPELVMQSLLIMLKFLNQGCQLNVLQQLLKVLVFHHSLNNQYLCLELVVQLLLIILKFLNQGSQLNVLLQLLKILVFHHFLNNQNLYPLVVQLIHIPLYSQTIRNAEQIQANNSGVLEIGPLKQFKKAELTYQELEKVIDKILIENPEPVKKFIRGDKHKREMSHCHLAGMALYMCKKRANMQMLDKLLWVKLNKVANKEHVQQPQLLNASKE